MSGSKLYRIPFTGFCEVWGDTPEEAAQEAEDGCMFTVFYEFGEPICMEREDQDELD